LNQGYKTKQTEKELKEIPSTRNESNRPFVDRMSGKKERAQERKRFVPEQQENKAVDQTGVQPMNKNIEHPIAKGIQAPKSVVDHVGERHERPVVGEFKDAAGFIRVQKILLEGFFPPRGRFDDRILDDDEVIVHHKTTALMRPIHKQAQQKQEKELKGFHEDGREER